MLRCAGLGCVCVLLACGGAATSTGAEEPHRWKDPEPESRDLKASDRMWHHFVDVAKARDAVIAGDLAAYRTPMNRLAEGRYGVATPAAWSEPLAALQAEAATRARAQDLEAAAAGVAAVTARCGACHVAKGASPAVQGHASPYRPHGREGISEAMARHVFAAEELWLGLTIPSDEAWQRGASALVDAPVPSVAAPDAGSDAALAQAVTAIRELGQRASATGELEARQRLYAQLLARCANCHSERHVELPPR